MLTTFVITLFVSVEVGIMTGIGISVLILIKNITTSHLSIYGRIPGTNKYRDIEKNPEAIRLHDILIVGSNDALYFSNVQKVKDLLSRIEKLGSHVIHPGEDHIKVDVKAVILVCKNISDMDVSAIQVIHEMKENYEHRKIFFGFSQLPKKFIKLFIDAGIFRTEEECVFSSIHEAVTYCEEHHNFNASDGNRYLQQELDYEMAESALIVRSTNTKVELPKKLQSNLKKKFLSSRRFNELNDEHTAQPKIVRRPSFSGSTELKSIQKQEPVLLEIPIEPSKGDEEITEDPPV